MLKTSFVAEKILTQYYDSLYITVNKPLTLDKRLGGLIGQNSRFRS